MISGVSRVPHSSTRRAFVTRAAAAPFVIRHLLSASPNSTVRLAAFGGGGMAWYTLDGIATHAKVKLACVADVDSSRVDRVKQKYPEAKIYQDWRQMLAREKHNIDIACIS